MQFDKVLGFAKSRKGGKKENESLKVNYLYCRITETGEQNKKCKQERENVKSF